MTNRRKYNNLVKYIKKLYDIYIHNFFLYNYVNRHYHRRRKSLIKKLLLLNLVNFNSIKIDILFRIEKQSNYLTLQRGDFTIYEYM